MQPRLYYTLLHSPLHPSDVIYWPGQVYVPTIHRQAAYYAAVTAKLIFSLIDSA